MVCGRCGLQWDIDDDDPPECLTVAEIERGKIKDILKKRTARGGYRAKVNQRTIL